ncbi:MAG: phage holin family protein [Chitinophagales bacterium]
MNFLIELLINAGILFLLAYLLPSVDIKSFGTAIAVALVIGILNATVGFLLRLPMNIVTLGLLSFFVRLLVTAIVIILTDKLFKGFTVKTFSAAVIIACTMAVAGTLVSYLFWPSATSY